MSYARLELEFEKIANPGVEYIMSTQVDQLITTPNALDTCLVVSKGDAGVAERIVRVATFAELITTPLEVFPTTVTVFQSLSLPLIAAPGIAVGDIIEIVDIPFVWGQFFGTTSFSTVVATILSGTEVTVVTPFPMFARGLTFKVWSGSSVVLPTVGDVPPYPSDGVANRDYTGLLGTEFLTPAHYDTWDDLDDAENKFDALKGQAQSIVDALNEDNFTGTFEELFE